MRSRPNRRQMVLFTGACALGTAIVLGAYAGGVLRSLELSSVDTRFSIRGPTGQPKDVVLVAVDEKTFGELRQSSPVAVPATIPRQGDRSDRRRRAGRRSQSTS